MISRAAVVHGVVDVPRLPSAMGEQEEAMTEQPAKMQAVEQGWEVVDPAEQAMWVRRWMICGQTLCLSSGCRSTILSSRGRTSARDRERLALQCHWKR